MGHKCYISGSSTPTRLQTETMNDQTLIERFIQQASQLVNNSELREDVESKLRILATSTFSKMDIVTREEFEAQTAVLERTRKKLDELEQQLVALSASVES